MQNTENRDRFLRAFMDAGIPSSVILEIAETMRGKTSAEAEVIAAQAVKDLEAGKYKGTEKKRG